MSHPALNRFNLTAPSGAASGAGALPTSGPQVEVHSPIDGQLLTTIASAAPADVERCIDAAADAFMNWRGVPPPRRGELVRRLGERLRAQKTELAKIVQLESGKITAEAEGEVQEMIDICDFAVGLSRQLYGLTIASERPGHRMMEQWLPLGPVGVITAFNFPVAVWAWNAALALVCGDPVIWKPSEKTPLSALACMQIEADVNKKRPDVPPAVLSVGS
jgi:aldehyde dehydrogenase (NAD+)